jgi:hypothetical protein
VSLAEDLAQFQSLFIDTAVVIYHIEAHPTFGPLAREAPLAAYPLDSP